MDTEFSPMQEIKRRFFAMRNGVTADALRRAGSPYRIIFGLNLPQIKDIANEFQSNGTLADALWLNTSTRESRLTAALIYGRQQLDSTRLNSLIDNIDETELADTFVMATLRNRDDRDAWIDSLIQSPSAIKRYMALRLAYTLVDDDATRPKALQIAKAEVERNDPMTIPLARRLAYDADF